MDIENSHRFIRERYESAEGEVIQVVYEYVTEMLAEDVQLACTLTRGCRERAVNRTTYIPRRIIAHHERYSPDELTGISGSAIPEIIRLKI